MPPDKDPTTDELKAMAYADGELTDADRTEFEARLATEPALARQVSEYRALEIIARQMAPPEPMAIFDWITWYPAPAWSVSGLRKVTTRCRWYGLRLFQHSFGCG